MGGKRTLSVCVALATFSCPAVAAGGLPHEFADCAGRYSAMLEHAWLMSEPAADYERTRDAFVALLEAVDAAPTATVLGRRIEAKAAQAELLRAATFGSDADQAEWARRRYEILLGLCRRLLLDG